MSKKHSFPKDKIRVLLLEKIHPAAAEIFTDAGYQVEIEPNALSDSALDSLIEEVHIIGVRSRTQLKAAQIQRAKKLWAVGCFTVGTDQVDLDAATTVGIPVFNAPHSSTRSVAELAVGNIISLARRTATKSMKMHAGRWEKTVSGAVEVRDKNIGILGYGHIGQQVGLLAEALGMNVYFYDIQKKLPLGRAKALSSLKDLLAVSDFLSLHVPGGQGTKNIIGAEQLKLMKPGAYLLNLSRGSVVDLPALAESLKSSHLSGAALDVFPQEPEQTVSAFESEMLNLDNVILTPHIGGSTEEAQRNIGKEVARSLVDYLDLGTTAGAVNFPAINLPLFPESHRILYIHQNQPGALSEVTSIIYSLGVNINAQYLSTYKDIGYLIMDINQALSEEVREKISVLSKAVKTRVLY